MALLFLALFWPRWSVRDEHECYLGGEADGGMFIIHNTRVCAHRFTTTVN